MVTAIIKVTNTVTYLEKTDLEEFMWSYLYSVCHNFCLVQDLVTKKLSISVNKSEEEINWEKEGNQIEEEEGHKGGDTGEGEPVRT